MQVRHCPNEGTQMRQFQKSGVVIDQCPQCRGVFLDAGELEHLEELASRYYGGGGGIPEYQGPSGVPSTPPPPTHSSYGHHGGHRGYDDDYYRYKKKKKKKGFLDELFD